MKVKGQTKIRFYKKLFVLVMILVSTNLSAAEVNPIQFLKKFNSTQDTVDFFANLYELEINFDSYNRPELLPILLKSEKHTANINSIQLSQIYFIIKKYYDANGNKSMSFDYALKIYKLLIQTKKDENLIWILIDIGNIFYSQKDYNNAHNFYQKAEEIAILEKQYHPLAVIYLNYGLIHSATKNNQLALSSLRKSNDYRLKSPNIKMISDNYVKMAEIFLKMNESDSSLFYLHKARFYYENKGINSTVLVEIPNQIDLIYAKYYLYKKEFGKAHQSIQLAKKYSRSKMLFSAYIDDIKIENEIFLTQKKYKEAIQNLIDLLDFLKQNKINDEQIEVYKSLGKIYALIGDYKNANKAYSSYIRLEKFWDNSNVQSKLNLIRSVSEMYESNAEIQESKEKLEIEKINYQLNINEKNTSIIIIVVAAISFFVFFILFLTQKNSKKRLKVLHQRMVDQNVEITLNSKELEKSNYLKDKLFSIIAHDLRNPLNRMLVELAILKKSIHQDQQVRQMEITLKETIELFEGLLQWSKLDGKKNIYNPTKINLRDCVNKTLKFYESEIEFRQIDVQIDLDSNFVFADINIIQTLFKNLISNGILYVTKSNHYRLIEIKSRQINPKMVQIYISNSGPEFTDELISEFYNQNENIISKSTGLGLSICKLLAKLFGWKIDIGNIENNKGAYLTIEIPIYDSQVNSEEIDFSNVNITGKNKERLNEFKNFKFYQISQIRTLMKSYKDLDDEYVKWWLGKLDVAVNEGDEKEYLRLLTLLNI
jgi:signal transduction histidine kinase